MLTNSTGFWAKGSWISAGEARLRQIVRAAGFGRFRRATQTPFFNLILEAKPGPGASGAWTLPTEIRCVDRSMAAVHLRSTLLIPSDRI
jgi:hypothetical protein